MYFLGEGRQVRALLVIGFAVSWFGCGQGGPKEAPKPTPKVDKKVSKDASAVPEAILKNTLTFKREGKVVAKLSVKEMIAITKPEIWSENDPHYNKTKTWRALELAPILRAVFKGQNLSLPEQEYLLRATDGYQSHMTGLTLFTPGAYVAIEDMDVPGWDPIGNRKANPGPFYVVWRKDNQKNMEAFDRPYQLGEVDMVSFKTAFPKTYPKGSEGNAQVMAGYEIYKTQCVRCHAINRQGGRVGPELNVPQNITEYRPVAQIKAYIKNPLTFRYGNMPAFKHFDDKALDGIVAYLTAMKDLKDDGEAKK